MQAPTGPRQATYAGCRVAEIREVDVLDPRIIVMLAVGILLLLSDISDLNRRRAATHPAEAEGEGDDKRL